MVELNKRWLIFNLVLDPEGNVLKIRVTVRRLKGAEKPGRRRARVERLMERSVGGELGAVIHVSWLSRLEGRRWKPIPRPKKRRVWFQICSWISGGSLGNGSKLWAEAMFDGSIFGGYCCLC